MRIYTRGGDDGSTSLADGSRVGKDDLRVAAYGEIDEFNATLGLLRQEGIGAPADQVVGRIQNLLFEVGTYLADPTDQRALPAEVCQPQWVEQWIDEMQAELPPLRNFLLPGGCRAAAAAHLARTVCRRAERQVVAAGRGGASVSDVLPFLNRVSDALFVLSRWLNSRDGAAEVIWRGRGSR